LVKGRRLAVGLQLSADVSGGSGGFGGISCIPAGVGGGKVGTGATTMAPD
jgi:hypothetical protein